MKVIIRSESIISILIVISLFLILFLSYSRWQNIQHQQENFLYQQQQALQIAENQIALKMANMECNKRSNFQNNLEFIVDCQPQYLKVKFPLGEISIEKP